MDHYDLIVIGSGAARGNSGRKVRQRRAGGGTRPACWRRIRAHWNQSVENPSKDRTQSFRLAQAGLLWPVLPRQAGYHCR